MYSPIPRIVQDEKKAEDTALTQSILKVSTNINFCFMWISCILFGVFAVSFYLKTVLANDFHVWEITVPGMYHQDHPNANTDILVHVFAGAVIMICIPIQFIKRIRREHIRLHRWTGLILVVCSCLVSLGALTYTFTVGSAMGHPSTVANGVQGMICAAETYRHAAWTKKIEIHQLWSYRLFAIVFSNLLFRLYYTAFFCLLPSLSRATLQPVFGAYPSIC